MRFNPHAFAAEQEEAAAVATAPPVAATTTPERSFISMYGRPGANRVTIPEHHTAVTLCLKHDDAGHSESFDSHATLGCPEFLLLLAGRQIAETEALARSALSLAPELHRLDWQWHHETYSGGHGRHLQSSPFPVPPSLTIHTRKTWGGEPITTVFWEIEFTIARRGATLELWPHKHYGKTPVFSPRSEARTLPTGIITARWQLNDPKRGVEIHFSRRPDDAALAPLRADRAWRYSGGSHCWYAKQSPATLAFAPAFVDRFNQPPAPEMPAPEPLPASSPVRKMIRLVDLLRPRV